jgi:hypothetical protein
MHLAGITRRVIERSGMDIGAPDAPVGQSIQVRGIDFAADAADVGEPRGRRPR